MDNAYINVLSTDLTDVVQVSNVEIIEGGTITVTVAYNTQPLYTSQLMWQEEDLGDGNWDPTWHKVPFRSSEVNGNKVAIANVSETGTFKVVNEPNAGPIAALTIAVLGFVLALCWVVARKLGYCGGTKAQKLPKETQEYANANNSIAMVESGL
eukprot:TRINITY_DN259_c0_g1_i2.p1 TRINITY_DN259_c0_g1~~TRINITY_DN259_c0_g1_i2.p1  ORF type:complete len:154 (+),score=13.28 TRINITY_DN259_c0_g1_i2:265-726(+)